MPTECPRPRPGTGALGAALAFALLGCGLVTAAAAWSQEPLVGAAGPAVPLHPYHARYSIYRNGKLTGKVDVDLLQQGEGEHTRWVVRSEGSGTHGLARILAAGDTEEVIGSLQPEGFQPLRYSRHTRVAGIDERWVVDFDWTARKVSIAHDRHDPLVLDMVGHTLDPLSLKLEMRRLLGQPEPQLQFQMVEEDEIEEQNFRLLPREWLETSLGCVHTLPVEKIRHNSKRYTRAWHAPDFDYIEVRMEHGKTDGNHLEMRITELSMEGREVMPQAGCAARQTRPQPTGGDAEEAD